MPITKDTASAVLTLTRWGTPIPQPGTARPPALTEDASMQQALATQLENPVMVLPPKPDTEGVVMTEDEYLATEPVSGVRREYIDGRAYAMAGGSLNHNLLALNVASAFRNHLKGSPCATYISDVRLRFKVSVGNDYVYPDVLVDCSKLVGQGLYTETPILVVEVLSDSTRRLDTTTKLIKYINLPSLEAYALVEQDIVCVCVLRKNNHWQPGYYYLGDTVTFESVGLTVSVEDIYERVDNPELTAYRLAKAAPAQADVASTTG